MDIGALKSSVRRFVSDTGGNFLILFGLAVGLIFLSAGLAFDYSASLASRARLANALDAATLATSRAIVSGELSPDDEAKIKDYHEAVFAANLDVADLASSDYSIEEIDLDKASETLTVKAAVDQPLFLVGSFIGRARQPIRIDSSTKFGINKAEVAMVLDVTGSMGGEKLQALKGAAKLAVREMLRHNTPSNPRVRISIVPYASAVRLGSLLRKYIYFDSYRAKSDAPVFDEALYRDTGFGYDVAAFEAAYPMAEPCNKENKCWRFHTHNNNKPASCVTGRKDPETAGRISYKYSNRGPDVGMIPRDARNTQGCPIKVMPLTSDQEALENVIDRYAAGGYTASAIGLQWGWYLISHPWADYLPAESRPADHHAAGARVSKFLIMMTDGDTNTAYADVKPSKWFQPPRHGGKRILWGRRHFKALCENVRKDGVTVFTIGFQVPDRARDYLRECASTSGGSTRFYYEPETSEELVSTFEEIARIIQTLRLIK